MMVSRILNWIFYVTFIVVSCSATWRGPIDDCEKCSVEAVDNFNNLKFYPRLASLLNVNYFRFYRANLNRPCPFWPPDGACSLRTCHVKACAESDLPAGIKEDHPHGYNNAKSALNGNNNNKPTEGRCTVPTKQESEQQDLLGQVDKTLTREHLEAIQSWREYDDAQYDFCELSDAGDANSEGEYVDLTINPERYTGYKGPSTQRIWRAIYSENCFKSERDFFSWTNDLDHLCLEQRLFYRLISGLHTSITVHLCAKYFNKITDTSDMLTSSPAAWGPNFDEFRKRFDNKLTGGQGAARLRNLYLLYLVELRALVKIAPYLLEQEAFFTGDKAHDGEVRHAVADLLAVAKTFPHHFDEKQLFHSLRDKTDVDSDSVRVRLRDEFRDKFRNISRIMACVGCDKCKLWGTLQTHGLGTALKILFWPENTPLPQLRRQEIVALFNAVGRLSTSVRELEVFAHILNAEYNNDYHSTHNEL